jgi:hypothetical protein
MSPLVGCCAPHSIDAAPWMIATFHPALSGKPLFLHGDRTPGGRRSVPVFGPMNGLF